VLDGRGDLVTSPFAHDLDAFYAAFLARPRAA
jgi:hypothetical protein